ncbi:CD109 antigen-like [Penaeus chinensis]|uniref:CD109 antigen-like n=1 Tax=Penaeus chinensis TaxID=139456 RepID=UPI001FB66473|nr:CD109 antigen-like [Penaeus chinensis]XP_047481543.1 CD109 antigen-like [Penaeus chinensis]
MALCRGGGTSCFLLLLLCLLPVFAQDLGRPDDDPRSIQYGSDNRWRNVLQLNNPRMRNRYNHPTHMILAPRTLRPGAVYRCVVSILYLDHPVDVRASLQKDGVEIASAKQDIIKGYPETLLLQVPRTSVDGHYRLRVEGNIPGSIGGTVFFNDTSLHFSTRFLTILVQTNRPVYTGDQVVRFRIILLNTELKPYDDPVDVYILDPDNYVMRRWPSRPTNVGVVSMEFTLPFLPKVGYWGIKVLVNGQEEIKRIKVEKWYTPRFEVKIFMPKYFLDTDEAIEGVLGGEFGNDKGAYGNATLKLFVKNKLYPNWTYVTEQIFEPFEGEVDFSFPMEELSKRISDLDGSEIRLEAEVQETFMMLNETGFSMAKIINSSINCRFVGSPPYVLKPGMPFEATVAVSYHDLEPLGEEKLHGSKLIVKAEAVLETGSREIVYDIEIPQVNSEDEEREFLDQSWQYNRKAQDYQAEGYKLDDYDYNFNFDYDTGSRFLTENELAKKKMEMFVRNQKFQKYREKGVYHFVVDVPEKTASLSLTASYQDDSGSIAAASATAIAYYSPRKLYIGVETSSKDASVGEFVVFHVRSNFNMESFHYLIMAKEMILYAAKEVLERTSRASVKTVSVPVSSEMAPAFKIIVYTTTPNHDIISDSLTMPVDGISRHKVKLVINQDKDHSKRTVELGTYSTAGAFYGISGVREFTYAMRGGNELSHASVMNSLHAFANNTRSIHKMAWRHREGFEPEEVEYYSAGNYGPDANRTFDFNGIIIFSDANVGVIPGYAENRCNGTEGYSPCLVGGCYPSYKRCDGIQDCSDGFDEISCVDPLEDKEEDFRIHRYQKFSDFFDAEDGDWLWLDINIGHKGHEQNLVEMPKVDDPYVLNAFSVSKEFGFGLVPAPQWYSIIPPVYVSLEMPDSCRRGEQVGMRVMVFNNIEQELLILLVLHGSDDHRFIMVEETGVVDFYRPRTMAGDHQHLVSVAPESAMEVIFPIVATVDQGEIELTVSAISQIGRDEETATLTVEPEGATIDRHTSILLDLKNRALVYEYMDIIVEESYVIPLQIRRRFVAGSPRGHVSLCGDVVGPSFPDDEPVDSLKMLRKELRGTEASTFNFGANLWTLHYLRLTNQLDISERQDIFDQLNVELAAIMYRFSSEGAFKMWDTSQPSVWLTAWTTRTIQMAQFQDWENIIYIEPRIISKAVEWLIQYQTPSGAFMETPTYQEVPLDKKADAYSYGFRWRGARNITLTAQCLITLERTINSLQGSVRSDANNARIQAVRYLERELRNIRDPYEVAIVAYALSVSNSVEKEAAFNQLDRIKREENGLVYWSRSPVQTNKRVYENNQRNLLQPKFEEEWDSHAVEASSYALLVYLIRDGVNIIQERIVEWLNAMRMHDGGFISTVDTLVALEALTEYSYRARLRDLTDMRVTVEATGEEGRVPHNVVISNTSVSQMHIIPIKNVWGLVNVVAHGAGQAILQLDVSYGIDWTDLKKQPPVDAFKMVINERYSKFRNKSICNVEICARWTNLDESPQSSATVIEVEIPTGYVAFQLDLERSIQQAQFSGNFPSLRDVIGGHGDTFAKKTVWFFDYIPGNTTWCFQYVMKRWYPVANLTRVRMATIYEQYQPERFQMVMLNSTVNTLDVCEVCGSYQCPYCPIYSSAPSLNLPNIGFLISVALLTYVYQVFSESRSFTGSKWPGGSGRGSVW